LGDAGKVPDQARSVSSKRVCQRLVWNFFEKKRQKTFIPDASSTGSDYPGPHAGGEIKVFASFFQKRSTSLLCRL
jgi:hypothetical protein